MSKELLVRSLRSKRGLSGLSGYVFSVVVVALFTAIGFATRDLLSNHHLGMFFLLGVVLVAYRAERGPVLLSVACSVAAFDLFFVRPYYTLAVGNPHFLVSFVAFAVVGATISSLTYRVREQERAVHEANLVAEAEKTRNALLSSVSHNLRTPLGSIIGSVSSLRDLRLDEKSRLEMLEMIREEAEYLQRLLDNLLQMTRLSDGKLIVRKEWQLPEEIVGSALRRLGSAMAQHRVDVRIGAEVGLAHFDGLLVELALVNLLDNAVKYSGEGQRIEVTVGRERRDVVWRVRDEGIGVPGDERRRVFDKFYRIPGRHQRGSGLGLAIVRASAEAHGGRAWVTAPDDGEPGTLVAFSLPVGRDAPSLPAEEPRVA